MTSPKIKSLKANIYLIALPRVLFAALFTLGIICVLHPELRQYIRSKVHKQYRVVLSTASGQLIKNHPVMKVIKIRTHEGLFLEVYGQDTIESSIRQLIDRIQLPDKRDGFFYFKGASANLFLHDIDGDDQLEILAPSFDENLIAHLNVYSLNPKTQKIEVKNPAQ